MQLSEPRFEPWVRWGLGAEFPSWLRVFARACVQNSFSGQLLLLHEGEPVGSGFRAPETTSKAAEPREAEAAQTLFGLWRPEGWGEKGKRWCAQQRRIVAVVCSPRRVYFSRMQISEPHFEPWVRWGLGAEFPSRLREACSGLRPEGIVRPTPALPRRKHIWSTHTLS